MLAKSKPYKLASKSYKNKTIVDVNGIKLGEQSSVLIAGPCAVESFEQTMRIAKKVQENGALILRGGAYKPRTSPYSFQGLGFKGIEILNTVREKLNLPYVTEAVDINSFECVADHADMIQIGARNMHNFELLRKAGRSKKPILLKRGASSTIEEFLLAAEYILNEGNEQIILCERGVRGFDPMTRNILDLAAVPLLKKLTHLPVIVDPSHATGIKELIIPLSRAALACGADGLIIETHDIPEMALCDGAQALNPSKLSSLKSWLKKPL